MTGFEGAALPDGWSWWPLKHVTSVLRRGTAPDYVDDGPVRVLSQAANQWQGWDWKKTRFHGYTGNPRLLKGFLEPEDTLVNSTGTGTLGRVGFFVDAPDERPCIADGHLTIARAIGGTVHPRFLYFYLRSSHALDFMMATCVAGSTNQIELNAERYGAVPVALPPMDEQRRIADYLDAETLRIDKMHSMQSRVMGLLYERQRAFLESQFVDGVDHEIKPLASLTDQTRPIMYGIVLPGPHVENGVPIVKGGDVAAGRLSLDKLSRTTREIESRYARSRLAGGDLIIAIRGSVGEVALVPAQLTGANLTQDAARIAPSPHVDPSWLQFVLETPFVAAEIQSRVTGATVKGINIWDLKRTPIPVPSAAHQHRLSGCASESLSEYRRILARISVQLNLLEERRRTLITAAVTGQFDVSTAGAGQYG
ncbi:restriction endonuclease subunit S [Spirillospora sp. NPDC047418]